MSFDEIGEIATRSETVAVIDLGSNSARLVLFKVQPDRSFRMVDEYKVSLRLAEHLGPGRVLGPEAIQRTIETARIFARFCRSHGVTRVRGVATAAIRAAANGPEIIRRIAAETGLQLEILSGDEEAVYDFLGVANTLAVTSCTIFDIGGGSTQIVRAVDRQPLDMTSLALGALNLTKEFLNRDVNSGAQLRRLEQHIDDSLSALPWLRAIGRAPAGSPGGTLVGLGGTVRAIAKVYKRHVNYPLDLLHGLVIPVVDVEALYQRVRKMSVAQRLAIPGLSGARAEILVAGLAVVRGLARVVGAETLLVSGRGIRDGIFLDDLLGGRREEVLLQDPGLFSTRNLMRRYDVPDRHAQHVATLSVSIFDQLLALHELGIAERRLLRIAALLHDIGLAVDYYNHDEHGLYLLTRTGVDGLSHRELLVVAYTVASQTGKNPLRRWPAFSGILDERDAGVIALLGGILTVAEALDRTRSVAVRSIELRIAPGRDKVSIKLDVDSDASVEVEHAVQALPDLARALGTRITLANPARRVERSHPTDRS